MFERFTDRARRIIVWAQDESRALNHGYIGTEHLMIALSRPSGEERYGESIPFLLLNELGVTPEALRKAVEEIVGKGNTAPVGHIPFTPRSKKVMELSLREALMLGHNYIGAEHLLLALVREGDGVGCQILARSGVSPEFLRPATINMLTTYSVLPIQASAARAIEIARAGTELPVPEKVHEPTPMPQSRISGEVIILSDSFDMVREIGAGFVVTQEVLDKLRPAAQNINNVPKDLETIRKLLE